MEAVSAVSSRVARFVDTILILDAFGLSYEAGSTSEPS
jgi:hypothetical protein